MTQVSDTIYRADGTPAQGTVILTWPAFTTADGKAVVAGSLSVKIGTGGAFSVSLEPNTAAQPAGVYYKVVYQLTGQEPSTEYWVVPATGSTSIGSVRAKLMPATIAAQVLTRDVADSNYVHVNGNSTVNGTVTFNASPEVPTPQNAGDAANKSYVDAAAGAGTNLASPPAIGNVAPNAGTFTTVNKVVNPATYSGSDIGAQINAAISANSCGDGIRACEIKLPPNSQQYGFTTGIVLPQDVRLVCSPKAQNSVYAPLQYNGSGVALTLSGESASVEGCDFTIGSSAAKGIYQNAPYSRVENVSLNGGGTGTTMLHISGANAAFDANVKIYNLTGTGVQVDSSTDVYLRTFNVYGKINGSNQTEQTSVGLLLESGLGGLQVTDWSGGGSGLHGIWVRNTLNPSSPPAWLTFYDVVSDCSAGGDGFLFDSSLGANQIGADITRIWSAGVGQDCAQLAMTNSGAVGVHISGGSGIHIRGGQVRANASHGVLIDSASSKDVEINDVQFTANGFATDFQPNRSYTLLNAYIRPQTNNAGNYLFKLTVLGTTANSQPTWCQTLNCTTASGTTTWQNIGTMAEADGVYVSTTVPQLNIHDNKFGNAPEGGGMITWGVRVDQDDPASDIHDNVVSDASSGAVKLPPTYFLNYLIEHDNANSANQPALQTYVGPASWKFPVGGNIGPMVTPNPASTGNYVMGFGTNLFWNGANFQTLTDLGNNGAALMSPSYTGSGFTFYVVPSNSPSSGGQTITPSGMTSYIKATIDGNGFNGVLGGTIPNNAFVNNLTINGTCTGCGGGGGNVNLASPPAIGNVAPSTGSFTTLRSADAASKSYPFVDVRAFGAIADGETAQNCAINAGSTILTCPIGSGTSANPGFVAADVGKTIEVEAAGVAGCGAHGTCPLLATIASYQSSSQVTLSAPAMKTETSIWISWGTDNRAAIQAAIDNVSQSSLEHEVYFPHVLDQPANGNPAPTHGYYAVSGTLYLPTENPAAGPNKFITLRGEGYQASGIQQLDVNKPLIEITNRGYAGTGWIISGLGLSAPANYSDYSGGDPGGAIYCHLCIQLHVTNDSWIGGFKYGIYFGANGQGTPGEILQIDGGTTIEEVTSAVKIPPAGVGGKANVVSIGPNVVFDEVLYGSYAVDLDGATAATINSVEFGPGVVHGISLKNTDNAVITANQFQGMVGCGNCAQQNLYLNNVLQSTITGNNFVSTNAEAVDIAGGNVGVSFSANTCNSTQGCYNITGANNQVHIQGETFFACPTRKCIYGDVTASTNNVVTDNWFTPGTSTPVFLQDNVANHNIVAQNSGDIAAATLSAQSIPGHAYFVSRYTSMQAALDAAYNNGTVLGQVIDDRTTPYTGPGFIVRDSVTLKLAATTYTINGTVSYNNGVANVTAGVISLPGSHIVGAGTSPNHGTNVNAGSGLNADLIATSTVGTGAGANAQWWHWGSIENFHIDGNKANETAGNCINVENMGETAVLRSLELGNCFASDILLEGNFATQSEISNVTVNSAGQFGVNLDNFQGVGVLRGLSGDSNATSIIRFNGEQSATLTVLGLKSEEEISGHDPLITIDMPTDGSQPAFTLLGGYTYARPGVQNVIKIINGKSGSAPFVNVSNFYVDANFVNAVNDTVNSRTFAAANMNKVPFAYLPTGSYQSGQAFTFAPGTFIQGGSSALTEIFGSSTDGSSMIASQGNGDGTSYYTGGLKIGIPNRTQFGQPPEMMARMGSRFLGSGSGYDTNTWVFVPIWKTGDASNRWIGDPNQRWPEVYAADVNATTATVGTLTVTSCAGCGGSQVNSDWNAGTGAAQILNKPAIPTAATTTPPMDSTGAVGTSASYARADHVHPTDTTRAAASTTVNGHPLTGNVTVTASDIGVPHSVSIQGPTAAVTGTGTMTALYSVTIPAGTFAVGTGLRCTARSRHTTGSASVSMAWKLGSTTYNYPTAYTTGSTGGDASIEIFTFASLTAETVNIPWASFGGTTESPYTGLAWSENLSSSSTLQFMFNVGNTDKLTGDSLYCVTVQ